MDDPAPSRDPLVEALKARQARRSLATTPSYVLSLVLVVAGAVLLIVGAWRPWVDLYGLGIPAISRADADAATASLLVAGAVLELLACAVALLGMRHRGRPPRFLHLVSVPVSLGGAVFWYQRLRENQNRVDVFNSVPDAPRSQLGDGSVITGVGLALGVIALLAAIPALRRAWRT